MPILGTVASQFAGKPFSSFESIQTVAVDSSSQAVITFSSIPSTYKHLQLRMLARNNSTWMRSVIKFNNDSTMSNYNTHGTQGTGSGASAFYSANDSKAGGANQTEGAGGSGVSVIDILDYTDTNKYKVARALFGFEGNGSGQVQTASILWRNTNSINTISITDEGGNNFTQYSHFALYGIKGA
jgi:hypothetical protein